MEDRRGALCRIRCVAGTDQPVRGGRAGSRGAQVGPLGFIWAAIVNRLDHLGRRDRERQLERHQRFE